MHTSRSREQMFTTGLDVGRLVLKYLVDFFEIMVANTTAFLVLYYSFREAPRHRFFNPPGLDASIFRPCQLQSDWMHHC